MVCLEKNPSAAEHARTILNKIAALSDEDLHSIFSNRTPKLTPAELRQSALERVYLSSPGTELPACIAHDIFALYIPPFLLLLGTIGNLLSFAVLCQRSMNQISTYVYMATLSLVDETVIIFGLLRYWVDALNGYRVEDLSSASCKLSQLLGYAASCLSVWLIVTLTCERVLVISFPLHVHRYAVSPRRAKLITAVIGAVFFAIALHFVHTVDLVPILDSRTGNATSYKCDFRPEFQSFERGWAWLDAILYSYLPFCLISVMNVIILVQVYKARRSRLRLMQGRSAICNPSLAIKINGGQNTASAAAAAADSGRQLTVMLLVVSCTFLITTTPIVVLKALHGEISVENARASAAMQLADVVALMLMYSNHAMNFFLYCATGRKFRMTLRKLFLRLVGGRRERHNTTQTLFSSDRRTVRTAMGPMSTTTAVEGREAREGVEMRLLLPKTATRGQRAEG